MTLRQKIPVEGKTNAQEALFMCQDNLATWVEIIYYHMAYILHVYIHMCNKISMNMARQQHIKIL